MHANTLASALLLAAVARAGEEHAAGPLERRLDNGLGKTPALGWNSWNVAKCNAASAASALNTAHAFVSLGLRELGYTYVNIDDCWSEKTRDAAGNLVANATAWPDGVKAVADRIHGMGLKFGLYGCAGTMTCARYPGSQDHEAQDARTLAAWGVDYWKYDNCFTPAGNTSAWYFRMRDALAKVDRPILYSMCQWGKDAVWTWGRTVGNSWRMSDDINDGWPSMAGIASAASLMGSYAAPGGFNDLDMMEIGNGGLTEPEERTHFGLWALLKSPIILGTDLTKIKPSSLAIIRNKGIIDINQDPLGRAAANFVPAGHAAPVAGDLYSYWAGPLADGAVALGLVATKAAATVAVNFTDVPGLGPGSWRWVEYYSNTTGTGTAVSVTLPLHDMAVFKVTKLLV